MILYIVIAVIAILLVCFCSKTRSNFDHDLSVQPYSDVYPLLQPFTEGCPDSCAQQNNVTIDANKCCRCRSTGMSSSFNPFARVPPNAVYGADLGYQKRYKKCMCMSGMDEACPL